MTKWRNALSPPKIASPSKSPQKKDTSRKKLVILNYDITNKACHLGKVGTDSKRMQL